MACVNPDGTISESGRAVLQAAAEPISPEEIAQAAGQPLFKVRSSVRQLVEAGFLEEKEGKYITTPAGQEKI